MKGMVISYTGSRVSGTFINIANSCISMLCAGLDFIEFLGYMTFQTVTFFLKNNAYFNFENAQYNYAGDHFMA